MRIIFVRHGEPNYEKDCLTDNGKGQAKQVAQRLKKEGITEIWASPQGRAVETAQETSALLDLPIQTLDFMHEISWGSRDGAPIYLGGHPWNLVDEMARHGDNLNDPDWRNHAYFRNNTAVDCVDLVQEKIDEWLSRLGYDRKGFYYDHRQAEEEHRTIALFSHGGSSCAAMSHILNLPFPYLCAMLHIDFTGIVILRMDRSKGVGTLPCMALGNDRMHIMEKR
ncbi:MAG: histidine phosphatase family protein [Lachnospiraceae bacterium]|nr:histidine phosphatase family protein [Lachnospiraceae bacterium]